MADYNDKEINLAKRIYDATMLVSDMTTTRRAKNLAKKFGFPPPSEIPDEYYLETARKLLSYAKEKLDKEIRIAAENM